MSKTKKSSLVKLNPNKSFINTHVRRKTKQKKSLENLEKNFIKKH